MSTTYKRPRGTEDILPEAACKWRWLEAKFRALAERYNFGEIRTPLFEQTELFTRSVGESTDLVGKEMYTFNDRGGRSMTLRPEGTAPVMRAFIENKLYGKAHVWKLYYLTPIFRYERPQAGRLRQAHQAGIELLGSASPQADLEVIAFAVDFFESVGLSHLELDVNSLGCARCRPAYRQALVEYFADKRDRLCQDCQARYETNPLRLLDCKVETCRTIAQAAPEPVDYLCDECRAHFEAVTSGLEKLGIRFQMNPRLVRGLDYYTRTAFEVKCNTLGAQNQVAGGGRYDALIEELGGPSTPGVGFALGLERTLLALEQVGKSPECDDHLDAYCVCFTPEAQSEAPALMHSLRKAGLKVDCDFVGRSPKKQLKLAAQSGAAFALLLGETELETGTVSVKALATGDQASVPAAEVAAYLQAQLGREGAKE